MFEELDRRAKKLGIVDVGLVKASVFFATIVLVKLFPGMTRLPYGVLIALALACGAWPLYVFWLKK